MCVRVFLHANGLCFKTSWEKKIRIKRLPPTTSNDKCDDDSDDGDRFDDKTTAVTDDDCDDSDAPFVSVCVCVFLTYFLQPKIEFHSKDMHC